MPFFRLESSLKSVWPRFFPTRRRPFWRGCPAIPLQALWAMIAPFSFPPLSGSLKAVCRKAFMSDFSVTDTVSEQLLHAHGLSAESLARNLALIGAHHVDYADIYCQHTAFESWHLEEGMVKSGSFQIDQGVGVRAVSGEKTAFA